MEVQIIDVRTMTLVGTLPGPTAAPVSFVQVAFWPDGKTVVGVANWQKVEGGANWQKTSQSSGVWAWDLTSQQEKWHKEFGESMSKASFSGDGQTLAVMFSGYVLLSPQAWMEVWDLKTRRKIGSQKGSKFFLSTIALSADGKRLAIELDNHLPRDPSTIEIWKAE
jgi:hypothetical protein